MSQHDYDIGNGGGAAVRADINAALLAILTQNSGATAPAVTKPFMFWYDTANTVLKQRNAADTAWVAFTDAAVPAGSITAAKMASDGAWAPTGTVLQVVSANLSTTVSTSSSSFVTTGLSASITPKFSTSKILVLVSGGSMQSNSSGQQCATTIYRNGSNLAGVNGLALCYTPSVTVQTPISMSIYDSPATTSSTTYEVYFGSVNTAGSVFLVLTNSKMTITLLEIAA